MQYRDRASQVGLWLLASLTLVSLATRTQAQVVPDRTLGNGNNSVTSTTGNRTDITGGLGRGSALFHSFERFNISPNQQVYFANPANIRNIFSRVTGGSLSNINGLLGVAGSANLFFMNPNGIIFGPNARLDVSGSFLATTANVLEFPDGQKFAATGDRAVPLVEVNIPIGLQFGANPPAMLTNRGNLATGQNLTLAAGNLDLQGQLQAGGNLTLNATDTVKIRDTVTEPFVARSGGDMTIQGNQSVDILALNHPTTTPFISSGNLSLVSDGIISGDAHYTSGGDFTIQNLLGNPGTFVSLYDPIIRSVGDVRFGDYRGASLKVEAAGSIRATGNITITGPDATPNPANDPDAGILSGGNALILRAGTPVAANVNLPSTQPTIPTNFAPQPITVPGSITVTGNISTSDNDNTTNDPVILRATGPISVSGITGNRTSIFGGSIEINTPDTVNIAGNLFVRRDVVQKAGDITIGNLDVPIAIAIGGGISTRNLLGVLPAGFNRDLNNPDANPDGGNIDIKTRGALSITGAFDTQTGNGVVPLNPGPNPANIVSIASAARNGRGGDISVSAGGEVNLAAGISAASNFNGKGGSITLIGNASPTDLGNPALVTTPNLPTAINTTRGVITSRNDGTVIINPDIPNSAMTFVANPGTAGNVALTARTGDVRSGSIIASYLNNADAGFARISLTSDTGSVFLDRARLSTTNLGSRDSGDIFIDADQLIQITNSRGPSPVDLDTDPANAPVNLGIESEGTFGRIFIGSSPFAPVGIVPDRVAIQNSSLSTQVLARHTGNPIPNQLTTPSNINITAGEIQVDNSFLNTRTASTAVNAGDITLTAQTGEVAITNNTQLTSTSAPNAGNAASTNFADITVQGRSVRVTRSSDIDASTSGVSRGGNVLLEATNGGAVTIDGSGVRSTVGATATGNGGNIQVTSGQFTLSNGASLDASNQSAAITTGGSVTVNATGTVALENSSSIRTAVELGSKGIGGDITIAGASSLSLTGGSRLSAQTSGTRNVGQDNARAGNINVTVNGSIDIAGTSAAGLSSGLFTSTDQAVSGRGGNIAIQATGNLQVRDRAVLSAQTQSTSDGGNITVDVNRLEALNGGQLTTTSTNSGAAGSITVTAPNGTLISGVAPPPGTVSPFTGLVIPELVGFTTTPDGNIDSDVTIPHTSQNNIVGNGTALYFGFAITTAGSVGIFDIDNGIKATPVPPGDPSNIDTELFLFNRDTGELLASNDDAFGTPLPGAGGSTSGVDSFINFTFPTPGNYVVGVGQFNSFASSGSLIQGNSPQAGQPFTLHVSLQSQGTSGAPTPNQSLASGLFAEAKGSGNAGQVTINSQQVRVADGAGISTSTNSGVGGNITLQNVNALQLDNGRIATSTQVGRAGNLTVNSGGGAAESIALSNNSSLSLAATTEGGAGTAGNIFLNTRQLTVQDNSSISASTAGSGVAGDLTVRANRGTADAITLLNSSGLNLGSTGSGNAGNVLLDTRQLTVQDSSITASTVSGTGSGVRLQGLNTLQMNNGKVIASTRTGRAGNVTVDASGNIDLINGSRIAVEANGANGVAGNVKVTGSNISLKGGADRSKISTSAMGENASAGNVTLNAIGHSVTLQNSDVIASSQQGASGNIAITARRIDLKNGKIQAEIGQNTADKTGSITLDASFRLTLEDESEISTLGQNGANGGDISIKNVRFLLGKSPTGPNGSDIVGRAEGGGQGGKVFLDRATLVKGFRFGKAVLGNRTNDVDTNGQLDNFSTDADVGARGLSTPVIIFTDVSQLNKSACEAVGAKAAVNSELRITGQGGVTLSPTATLPAQPTSSDWVSLDVSPQVPTNVTFSNGATVTLEPGQTYQVQATCVKSWKEQQRSLL